MDLALGRLVPLEELRVALEELLPVVRVHVTDNGDLSVAPDSDVLVLSQAVLAPDFPTGLGVSLITSPGHDIADWLLDLAEALSVRLATTVLCDGSRYGDDSSPFWCVVWDIGRAYLADDCGSVLADGRGGPVRIIRPLALPPSRERPSLADRVAPSWG